MTPRPRLRRLALLCALALLGFCTLVGCNAYPDKRQLQYLNTEGFGNRYSGNAEEENYVRIGDTLGITDAYQDTELGLNATVDIDGTVLLPELGAVPVAGLTRSEIEALLMEKYSAYYDLLDIRVKIQTTGKKYFIFGEVQVEGERPFLGDLTVFEAVMNSIPTRETANLGRVRLIRADPRDPLVLTLDLSEILETGDSTFNVHVQERDIIFVPATMLAQFGYFLDTLLFPVKLVISGLANAFWAWTWFDTGTVGRRGNTNNSGFF
jgi:protein involved in polysaccharide export with SLBB domain